MTALFLDGLGALDWPFDGDRPLAAVFVRVTDHSASLHPAERELVANVGRARLRAFSSGRRAARCALGELGVRGQPVLARGRAPLWPTGVVGSITHSATLAAAVAGHAANWAGVGADLTPQSRVSARVAQRVLLPAEREALPSNEWRTAIFSAKESVYKAVNPLCGEFLAFRDVRVTVVDGNAFTAVTTRPCASTATVAAGEGRFFRYANHWLTVFAVAESASGRVPQLGDSHRRRV